MSVLQKYSAEEHTHPPHPPLFFFFFLYTIHLSLTLCICQLSLQGMTYVTCISVLVTKVFYY